MEFFKYHDIRTERTGNLVTMALCSRASYKTLCDRSGDLYGVECLFFCQLIDYEEAIFPLQFLTQQFSAIHLWETLKRSCYGMLCTLH
jgi:hypothetical protein